MVDIKNKLNETTYVAEPDASIQIIKNLKDKYEINSNDLDDFMFAFWQLQTAIQNGADISRLAELY